MIFLLDADGTGRDSISKRIASKQVTLLPCGSFVAYDAACMQLANRTPAPGDRVVLDTFSIMLSTTRGDFKHGNDPKTSVWEDNQKVVRRQARHERLSGRLEHDDALAA